VEYRAGTRLKSAVCTTEVIVVKSPKGSGVVLCGGSPMLDVREEPAIGGAPVPDAMDGTQLGKRYVDEQAGLEVLCTKQGDGSLALDDRPLEIQGAKALPPSD
jgi:hypothetical protein